MNKTELIATLHKIRSNPSYQTAEATRLKVGDVAAMAKAKKNTASYGAITLLINTWETISLLVLPMKNKDLVFLVTPVSYMYTELSKAIEILGKDVPHYAENFSLLNKQQLEWLTYKDERYQTGEKGGMHALFG